MSRGFLHELNITVTIEQDAKNIMTGSRSRPTKRWLTVIDSLSKKYFKKNVICSAVKAMCLAFFYGLAFVILLTGFKGTCYKCKWAAMANV